MFRPKLLSEYFLSDRFINDHGNRKRPVYSPKLGNDGVLNFSCVTYDDRYAKIQSYAPFTDMSYIINQLLHGNMSVLRSDGLFGDFTGCPTNRHELFEMALNVQNEFDKLPLDAKKFYSNDWRKWFSDVGSDSWLKSLGLVKPNVKDDNPNVKDDNPYVKDDKPILVDHGDDVKDVSK